MSAPFEAGVVSEHFIYCLYTIAADHEQGMKCTSTVSGTTCMTYVAVHSATHLGSLPYDGVYNLRSAFLGCIIPPADGKQYPFLGKGEFLYDITLLRS